MSREKKHKLDAFSEVRGFALQVATIGIDFPDVADLSAAAQAALADLAHALLGESGKKPAGADQIK